MHVTYPRRFQNLSLILKKTMFGATKLRAM